MNNSCIICLNDNSRKYYNVCDKCNNFIICKQCFRTKNTHKIVNCVHCRQKLIKDDNIIQGPFLFSYLYFLRFVFIYVLFIIIPSNIIASYFPDKIDSNTVITTNKNLFIIITNINYILIVPYLLYYYITQFYLILTLYCFNNILFLILLLSNAHTINNFFIIYTILSMYTFVYLHLSIIILVELLYFYAKKIDDFVHKQQIYVLKIYDTLYTNTTPIQVHTV
jgi:hypothetical protein